MTRFIRKIRKNKTEGAQHEATSAVPPFCLLNEQYASSAIQEVVTRLGIDQSEIDDIYPCTPLQESLIFQTICQPTANVAQTTHALPQSCALAKLKDAWKQVCKANPILRTRIVQTENGVVQVVLRGQPGLFQGDVLKTHLDLDRARGMHLQQPLLRLALITETGKNNGASVDKTVYMVITIHRALQDEWSEALMLEQLEAAYGGTLLPTRPFAPFVKYIQGNKPLSERFWKKEIALINVPAAVFPPVHSPSYQPVADSISSCFLEFTNRHSLSRFTLSTQLQLTWALLMHHFTSSEAVVFGVTVDGRSAPIPGIEAITGPTLASIPCRLHFRPSMTVEDALYSIQETSYWSLPFEQFGLQNIQKLSGTALDLCKLQSMLVIRPRLPPRRSSFLRRIPARHPTNALYDTCPLTLECSILDTGVELHATFDVNILSKERMQRVLHHFKYIFAEVAGDGTRSIAQINSITSHDIAQLTEWYTELQAQQPREHQMVHKLIQHQCETQPAALAVHAWDGDFSYRDIELLSSRLAAHLVREGVYPESMVPICFEKSKWLAVIMIAVIKAGAAFVLLDPSSQPLERMRLIVEGVKGKLILCSESLLSTAVQIPGTRSLIVADGAPCFSSNPKAPENLPVLTGRTALYVIFTSGSTGTPKGVVIEHGGYSAGALSRRKITGLNSSSRVLQFASCAFDTFITDILDTLIVGACICIPSESARHAGLAQAARSMAVTYADLVPSVARLMKPKDIPTLKTLVLSGESVAQSDVAEWADKVRLCNLYGPAECSAVATGHAYPGPHSNPSNIGRGCGGTCWVVNPTNTDKLLPIGAVGELVVEGGVVGRGYLGHAHEQASYNFLDYTPPWRHGFPGMDGDTRMYKTGDLVQYQEDGTLLFVGRKDGQVKLHGQRLELGDVEHHLRTAFPASLDVVAVIVSALIERLVAFIAVGNDMREHVARAPKSDEQTLIEHNIHITSTPKFRHSIGAAERVLRRCLPAYMVPTAYFPIRQLPRTSSGKVNRTVLQTAVAALILRDGLANFTAARERRDASTEAEKILQSIWAQVLGIEPAGISAEDGFLALGGDSIAAMRVAALAASRGLHICIPKLFQNESLENLTATIELHQPPQHLIWDEETAFPPMMEACASHRAEAGSLSYSGLPAEVLLTGATGRLGREILKRLIACPSIGKIHCVAVRCLKKLLPQEKVVVYHGDLSRPRLGMSEQDENALMQRCQAIIHCGAIVSFVQNYETMRFVNVESTKYLAALALQNFIPFHYISTADVGQKEGHAVIEEVSAAWNEPPVDGADGYTATKWVSEVFLEKVNSCFGLDVTIHRPSNITCDGDPEKDIVNNLLEYSRRLNTVPRLKGWEGHFDLIRGEVVASNIVDSMMTSITQTARDGSQSRRGVQYIHESGETVISVGGLGAYLANDEAAPLQTIDMQKWAEMAIQEGMASVVGDFLCSMEESEEKMTLPLIETSRRPLTD